MRALVHYGSQPGSVELREVPQPTITPSEVLLRSQAVGVCGSDLHQWHGTQAWHVNMPVTLGHEFCGEIALVGTDVTGWAVGDRVTCETAARVCGTCAMCRSGHYNVCPHRLGFGYGINGAAATYVAVRPALLHRLPDTVTWEEAALTEPCCVAFNAVIQKSHPRPGDLAVVIGPGPIGLLCTQMLRLCGVGHLIMVGLARDSARLALARDMGADEVIISDEGDPVARVCAHGDGWGAHLVIDAVGFAATLRQALDMVRPEGQITKIGWDPKPVGFSLDALVAKAVTLQGSFSHNYDTWERVVHLMGTHTIDVRPLIHRYDLADWQAAFQRMDSLEVPKVVLIP